jgi:putative ABC transport system permease protein
MLMLSWARGLVLHRPGRLLGAMAGVGITVSLLACLGVFIASSAATMTARALANLPIDWRDSINSGADEQAIGTRSNASLDPPRWKPLLTPTCLA